ncbi:glycosyltransferase family 4 protein [Desulfuromonas sp. KJ2020]|uniref:glycosyltransferase family 4 protein n=1 Tax=Desulfuromonas sp. KJ2020 TaxID=2919173 RepID=UPI000322DDC3|nr:glycosyltransferase family 1 protein [Desulfuromonas sp. KJ2020]MCP3175631.1 glycosyltransferase family 4 protein [Desulfuromonas sp. KJ2020]
MKKIGLYLEVEPHFGGTFQIAQSMLEALIALPSDRFSVVVGYASEQWLPHLEKYEVASVPIPLGKWGRAAGLGWTLMGLPMGLWRQMTPHFHPVARALLKEGCDLWIFPSYDQRSYQYPVSALVSIHDLMYRYERRFPESGSWWNFYNKDRINRNNCRWSTGILVDSELGRQQMVEAYDIAPDRVHPLPFIAPSYMHSTRVRPDFDEQYRLPDKYIFYPAQFWWHKNHSNLLKAVASLKSELPDLKVVLSGGRQNAYEAIIKLVHELGLEGDVIFAGYVSEEDMPEFYRRARAMVMPTYYGPTNVPPLEAFSVGCPVAISGLYGMPEQAAGAALHFNPDSTTEIAECIRRLWTDDSLCRELSEKGKRRIASWGQKHFNTRFKEIIAVAVANPR